MAEKQLNHGVKVQFADGKERVIRPLTISQLRKFMKVAKDMDVEKNVLEDSDIDNMVNAAEIVFSKVDPDITRDELEEILDLKSFNLMFAAAMGTDPNE